MANLLVYIELKGKEASPASLSALNTGRVVATGLGATLYALLPCSALPSYGNDDVIAVLGRHGADKVILVTGPGLEDAPLHATHGEALRAACVQFRPRLTLLASTAAGRDIAPRLAMQIGALYQAEVELQHAEDDFQLAGLTFRRRLRITTSLRGAAAPIVATLLAPAAAREVGDEEAEVIMMQSPARDARLPRVDGRRRSPEGDPAAARLVLGGGAGLRSRESFARLARLASALDAAAVVSPTASAAQLAGPELSLLGHINAPLYVTFGVSGSERHLASLPPWTRVMAVNTDPSARIAQIAERVLVADADRTLEELLAELAPSGDE